MLRPTLEAAADHGSSRAAPATRGPVRRAATSAASDAPVAADAPTTPAPRSAPNIPPPKTRRARLVVNHRDDPVARRVFNRAILGGGPGLR